MKDSQTMTATPTTTELYALHEFLGIHNFKRGGKSMWSACDCGMIRRNGCDVVVGTRFPHTEKFKVYIMNAIGRDGYRRMRKLYRFYDSGKR